LDLAYLFFFVGFIFIALIWKRLFNLGGKLFLGSYLLIFIIATLRSIYYGLGVLFILAVFTVYFLVNNKKKSLTYFPAEATFETSEVLRGLTPVEAGYFLKLPQDELFIIAILDLLDSEIIVLQSSKPIRLVQLAKGYQIPKNFISPENKRGFRINAAKHNKKIIHQYDDLILEMISARKQMNISGFDVDLWFRIFLQSMEKLERVYQPALTKAYASKIASKYTSVDSEFSKGKANISGWFAVSILTGKTDDEIEHRPAWLAPDDVFSSVVLALLEALKN